MKARFARPLAATLALSLTPAAHAGEPLVDLYGDPLPRGAVARLGTVRFRSPQVIREAQVSPDGKRVAACSNRGWFVVDADSGRVLSDAPFSRGADGPFVWTPDGRGVMLLSDSPDNPRLVELTGAGLRPLAPKAPDGLEPTRKVEETEAGPLSRTPGPFALSPDGKLLAAEVFDPAVRGRAVVLHESAVGVCFRQLKPVRSLGAAPGKCAALLFTRDGAALGALCASDKKGEHRFVLWDLATGKERWRRTIPSPLDEQGRWSLALSPDGRWLAVGLEDGTARLFDLAAGSGPFARHAGTEGRHKGISAVAFSPDGKLLVTAGRDGMLRGWDPDTLREVRPARNTGESIESIAFSPDGSRVFTAGDTRTLRRWDAVTFAEAGAADGHRGLVYSAAVSPDGRTAVTAGSDGTVRVWDLATGRQRRRIDTNDGTACRLAVAADGKTALAMRDESLRAWDLTTGEALPLPGELGNAGSTCRGFGSGGRALVFAGEESASLWDWPTGRRLRTFDLTGGTGRSDYIYCSGAALSADGSLLATSGLRRMGGVGRGFVHTEVWDTATGKRVAQLGSSAPQSASPLFLPSGRDLVIAACPVGSPRPGRRLPGSVLGLWGARTGEARRAFAAAEPDDPSGQLVHDIVVSADGRTLATAETTGPVLYEVATGQVRWRLSGHASGVFGVAFTPDGRRLVTTGPDHAALVWDVRLAGASPRPLAEGERGELWATLSADPAQTAFEAMARFHADAPATVAYFNECLRPIRKLDRAALDHLFTGLEHDRFAVRQRAAAELDRLGRTMIGPAREWRAKAASEDGRERLKRFLEVHAKEELTPEELRQARAVELLEGIGSPEARALLRELAGGEPAALLTREAAGSLRRLEKSPRACPQEL